MNTRPQREESSMEEVISRLGALTIGENPSVGVGIPKWHIKDFESGSRLADKFRRWGLASTYEGDQLTVQREERGVSARHVIFYDLGTQIEYEVWHTPEILSISGAWPKGRTPWRSMRTMIKIVGAQIKWKLALPTFP